MVEMNPSGTGKQDASSPTVPPTKVAAKTPRPIHERELVLASAAGDRAAREELVAAFLPSISAVARRYRTVSGVQRPELLQEGVVGLLRAVERFDPTAGTPFWAYASWWVRQAMQQLVSELGRPTVLSDRAQRTLARVREARAAYVQAHRHQPSIADLVAASGLSRGQVESVLAVERPPRMLSEPLDNGDGIAGTLGEQIVDPVSEDEYERIIEQLATEQVRPLTDVLDDRERSVLYDHYGIDRPPRTLREIASSLGLSAEGVRQIEERALKKLRNAATSTDPLRRFPGSCAGDRTA
jgi:RNA polymerase primary sigma factor